MATWEIDRFGVKPSGFLAAWRYVKVLTDELGNITIANIPGKNFPNLNCITDYKKSDRKFGINSLITSFCNLTTFTNYRIYAQNCKPYAYVQTDLNAAKCGYLVPLPEPYVPITPFGEANYGFYAYLNICDNKNVPINIRIYKRNYVGDSIKINSGGTSPAILSYKNTDESKLNPIRACEFQLTMVADGSFDLEQFYTKDEREFKVQVLKDGVQKFLGFGTPSEASEEFAATPYDITWRATDGLGALKLIDYPVPIGSKIDIKQTFLEIICYCLAMTNLNLDIATICNLYEVKMLNGLDDDPLMQSSVNPLRMSEKGKIFNCYQVLEKICLQFGAFLIQDNGVWHFVRQSELANDVLRKRIYNYKGLFLRSEQFHNARIATCKGDDITILDDDPTLRIGNAYKRAEVIVDFGEVPFLLYNGDFEIYNGNNFAGFTKYGGIKVSRTEKLIFTTTGPIPSGQYALQFDEVANNAKYFEALNLQASYKDKMTLSFGVSKYIFLNNLFGGTIGFKIRIKIGTYYLINPNGDSNYVWVNQLVTCTVPITTINNSSDNLYNVQINMPEAPVGGTLVIQLFGFVVPGVYTPVYIDNLTLSKSKEDEVGRILYISQQDGFYTTKPEPTKLLFGDYASSDFDFVFDASTLVINGLWNDGTFGFGQDNGIISGSGSISTVKKDQYAIFTKDGSYSTGWYEFGGSTVPTPIGLILARNILKAYQKPFRFLESSFLGVDISYLDIFNVNLPNNPDFNERVFALLSGNFDLVAGEVKNANYVEIFNKPGKSVDIISAGNDGDPFPPITQNPNPTPILGGIFTSEFTQEFQ